MKKAIAILFLLSACSYPHTSDPIVMHSAKRQKQKLMVLQKKLESAEKQQSKVSNEIDFIREEVQQLELAIIRTAVESCEEKLNSYQEIPPNLFLAERETLHKLIQSGPSPSSFEAQVVLDQILRIITNLSESD
jgi:CRISPR/Cas system CMR subunit Cmr6 (Cas7 group RAMP superfamily)